MIIKNACGIVLWGNIKALPEERARVIAVNHRYHACSENQYYDRFKEAIITFNYRTMCCKITLVLLAPNPTAHYCFEDNNQN